MKVYSHPMEVRCHVRSAVPGDAALILQMIKELAEYEKLSHEVSADENDIHQTLLQPNAPARCLLGFVDGEPAGFAVYFLNYSTFQGKYGIYLEDLFVRPRHRGLGLGRELLEEIINFAKANDYGRVEWAVLDWNESAMQFYEKLGAREMREWVRFRITLDNRAPKGK